MMSPAKRHTHWSSRQLRKGDGYVSYLSSVSKCVVQDELDTLSSPRIVLSIRQRAGRVAIPDDILRLVERVDGPCVGAIVPVLEAVGVKVVDEARPGLAHQLGELGVRGAFVGERVDGAVLGVIAQSVDVVEDEGNLLEVRHAEVVRDAVRCRVEAVAVGVDAFAGPGFACPTTVGNHDYITEVCSLATVLLGIAEGGWEAGEIARKCGLWRDKVIAFQGVGIRQLVAKLRRKWGLGPVRCRSVDELLCSVDAGTSERCAFISIGAVDNGDVHKSTLRKLNAGPSGNEIAVNDWVEEGLVLCRVEDGVEIFVGHVSQALQGIDRRRAVSHVDYSIVRRLVFLVCLVA